MKVECEPRQDHLTCETSGYLIWEVLCSHHRSAREQADLLINRHLRNLVDCTLIRDETSGLSFLCEGRRDPDDSNEKSSLPTACELLSFLCAQSSANGGFSRQMYGGFWENAPLSRCSHRSTGWPDSFHPCTRGSRSRNRPCPGKRKDDELPKYRCEKDRCYACDCRTCDGVEAQ